MTILEDYLSSFTGIVVAVSHDRYFLDNVADRILAFEGEGKLAQYEGGYTDYVMARDSRQQDAAKRQAGESARKKQTEEDAQKKPAAGSAADWKQHRSAKLKFTYKEEREYETIDADIAALEAKLEKLDGEIMANATNS